MILGSNVVIVSISFVNDLRPSASLTPSAMGNSSASPLRCAAGVWIVRECRGVGAAGEGRGGRGGQGRGRKDRVGAGGEATVRSVCGGVVRDVWLGAYLFSKVSVVAKSVLSVA